MKKELKNIVKIIKSDPIDYRSFINTLKRLESRNINISHQSSAFSYLPIFQYIKNSLYEEDWEDMIFKNPIYIGKPHGFYSFISAFNDYRITYNMYCDYYQNDQNGVINREKIKYIFERMSYNQIEYDFLENIEYIAKTMGSVLSVAQGASLIKPHYKRYVLMSDAETEMGEFYENLLLQKKYNFNTVLLIDYNGYSKQNKTINSIEDLKILLELYNQPAIIFDNMEFKEYFEKEG